MKRTLLLFLILVISVSMGAWAQVKIDGIYYNLNEEAKTAEVIKPLFANDYMTNYSGDIVIPASVTYEGKDYIVTSLGSSAFSAFYDITSIALPTSLTNIGKSAFANCNGLSALEIPEGVKTIGESAFLGCQYLTSIVIPNSVDSIGRSAFYGCRGLVSVKFGSGLKSVGRSLFTECTNLVSIEISNDNPYYDSREGCNAIIETCTNKLVAGCNTTIVPSSVKSIATAAFMYCTFTSFELPDGLEEIENCAFYKCKNLTDITIPASVKSMGYSFYDCSSLVSLKVDSNNKFYDSRENCNAVIETATNQLVLGCKTSFIPNSVTSIGDDAFGGCRELPFIELPSGLTSIGADAFAYCTFTSVTIPDGVTTIGVAAFSDCRLLKTVSLPQSLTSLGLGAFSYCDALTSIYIYAKQPPTVTKYVGTGIYDHCTLYVPEGSEEAYAAAEGWKDFKNIVAIPDEIIDNAIAINEENFPDINFRNWLLSQKYGKDGVLTDEEISDITEINVEKKDIANLQGIEKFTSLTSLYCSINELTTLDLSGCPQLNALDCSFNKQLASINLSGCKALQHLYCHGCKLTAIDLTDCTELIYLDCGTNLLTTIDPSPCQKVMSFVCSRNQLTTIDISACKALRSFDCQENQLTTLDCSGLTELQAILCAMNALTSINISGCSKLIHLLCEFNNLGLDAFQHIMTNIPERDESDEAFMFVYSESTIEGSYDHTPDHNICSKEQVAIAKAKGWVVYYENNTGDSLPYEGVEVTPEIAYRPFIEDGKVWKVGGKDSGNPVKFVAYYYFDGDTIIGGKTCKQMMCQRYVSPDHPNNYYYDYWVQLPSLSKVGAWYEEDKKVYVCREGTQGMQMLYDFSLEVNDTLILNLYQPYYTVGPKQTGGLNGFKGVYRDIMLCGQDIYITTWLEGVGGIDGPLRNVYPETESDPQFLMSCTVGDEVIYLDDQYEDGATPSMETKKRRFDFTHTVKIQPKTPRRGEETALYGEYNDQSLDIRLDSLDEAYLVRITDKSGKAVYEKTINASSIVGLNIDISSYPEGQYTITIENSKETFTGEFDTNATAIAEIVNGKSSNGKTIFNFQGQRIKTLQKGLNIVGGKKIFVK